MAIRKTTSNTEKKQLKKIVLASLSPEELLQKAALLRTEITKTRLDIKIGRVKNVRKVFNLRKQLARVLSVLK